MHQNAKGMYGGTAVIIKLISDLLVAVHVAVVLLNSSATRQFSQLPSPT